MRGWAPDEVFVNIKKVVQLPAVLTLLATVASLPACGGSVDATTCTSVKVGDSRADVDAKLGEAVSVSKVVNGAFAIGRYETTRDENKQCCLVTFDSDTDSASTVTQPAFQSTCK